jgi:hypothetical protein
VKKEILFQETQKFNQWWLWILFMGVVLLLLSRFNWDKDFVDQLSIDKIIPSSIAVVVLLLFLTLKLTTTITEEKIALSFYPFTKREFYWTGLQFAQVIDYGFKGGWGIRIWTSYGTIYNIRGSKGLHIKTADKHYVIGTQEEKELRSKIAHLLK